MSSRRRRSQENSDDDDEDIDTEEDDNDSEIEDDDEDSVREVLDVNNDLNERHPESDAQDDANGLPVGVGQTSRPDFESNVDPIASRPDDGANETVLEKRDSAIHTDDKKSLSKTEKGKDRRSDPSSKLDPMKKKDPTFVPHSGNFFLHDDRADSGTATTGRAVKSTRGGKQSDDSRSAPNEHDDRGGKSLVDTEPDQRTRKERPNQRAAKSKGDDFEWKHDKFEEFVAKDNSRRGSGGGGGGGGDIGGRKGSRPPRDDSQQGGSRNSGGKLVKDASNKDTLVRDEDGNRRPAGVDRKGVNVPVSSATARNVDGSIGRHLANQTRPSATSMNGKVAIAGKVANVSNVPAGTAVGANIAGISGDNKSATISATNGVDSKTSHVHDARTLTSKGQSGQSQTRSPAQSQDSRSRAGPSTAVSSSQDVRAQSSSATKRPNASATGDARAPTTSSTSTSTSMPVASRADHANKTSLPPQHYTPRPSASTTSFMPVNTTANTYSNNTANSYGPVTVSDSSNNSNSSSIPPNTMTMSTIQRTASQEQNTPALKATAPAFSPRITSVAGGSAPGGTFSPLQSSDTSSRHPSASDLYYHPSSTSGSTQNSNHGKNGSNGSNGSGSMNASMFQAPMHIATMGSGNGSDRSLGRSQSQGRGYSNEELATMTMYGSASDLQQMQQQLQMQQLQMQQSQYNNHGSEIDHRHMIDPNLVVDNNMELTMQMAAMGMNVGMMSNHQYSSGVRGVGAGGISGMGTMMNGGSGGSMDALTLAQLNLLGGVGSGNMAGVGMSPQPPLGAGGGGYMPSAQPYHHSNHGMTVYDSIMYGMDPSYTSGMSGVGGNGGGGVGALGGVGGVGSVGLHGDGSMVAGSMVTGRRGPIETGGTTWYTDPALVGMSNGIPVSSMTDHPTYQTSSTHYDYQPGRTHSYQQHQQHQHQPQQAVALPYSTSITTSTMNGVMSPASSYPASGMSTPTVSTRNKMVSPNNFTTSTAGSSLSSNITPNAAPYYPAGALGSSTSYAPIHTSNTSGATTNIAATLNGSNKSKSASAITNAAVAAVAAAAAVALDAKAKAFNPGAKVFQAAAGTGAGTGTGTGAEVAAGLNGPTASATSTNILSTNDVTSNSCHNDTTVTPNEVSTTNKSIDSGDNIREGNENEQQQQ